MASHPTAGDLQVITRIAVFRGLKRETVEHIIAPATAVMLAAHETLFRQGDPATAFFIMIDGWMKLYRITLSGEETVIHVMTRGDSFGEAVAFGKAGRAGEHQRGAGLDGAEMPVAELVLCAQQQARLSRRRAQQRFAPFRIAVLERGAAQSAAVEPAGVQPVCAFSPHASAVSPSAPGLEA